MILRSVEYDKALSIPAFMSHCCYRSLSIQQVSSLGDVSIPSPQSIVEHMALTAALHPSQLCRGLPWFDETADEQMPTVSSDL